MPQLLQLLRWPVAALLPVGASGAGVTWQPLLWPYQSGDVPINNSDKAAVTETNAE